METILRILSEISQQYFDDVLSGTRQLALDFAEAFSKLWEDELRAIFTGPFGFVGPLVVFGKAMTDAFGDWWFNSKGRLARVIIRVIEIELPWPKVFRSRVVTLDRAFAMHVKLVAEFGLEVSQGNIPLSTTVILKLNSFIGRLKLLKAFDLLKFITKKLVGLTLLLGRILLNVFQVFTGYACLILLVFTIVEIQKNPQRFLAMCLRQTNPRLSLDKPARQYRVRV